MRDVIARAAMWVLRLLLPARGRHAALPDPEPTTEALSGAVWGRPWQGPSAETVREIFRECPELPYLQRERWRAAAFAEIGIDYDHPTTNITPVRAAAA
ncbi:hypothetical protein [Streptomyces sp. BPTC-684]|uniref:hypothetical protein n=1 Tax=Streptomyces sp. BPTC-684 TaxID=3043734 RepID=UPI0024B16C45|nr:hypothetical protein [Streptomyces sp. BPTC-684]WHM36245.1 hypothetical protein QIY60_04395 [Streptomyces sp. BPTC-684]